VRIFEMAAERWEIELEELRVLTRRYVDDVLVGEEPTEYLSPLHAKWAADKVCSRLVDSGFTRTSDPVAPLAKAEFEDALRASPDDLDTYLVYADWLSDRGDDWGQLITIQHALATLPPRTRLDDPRRAELERTETMLRFRLGSRLWGPLGETVFDEMTHTYLCDLIDADWFCGFVRGIRCSRITQDIFPVLMREFGKLPISIVLRTVELWTREWPDDTLDAFVMQKWPLVERVKIEGAFDGTLLVYLLANSPKLETLIVHGAHFSERAINALAGMKPGNEARLANLQLSGTMPPDAHERLRHLAPNVRAMPL
jgi:uncharacterized protein (TIGR02996 family)